MKNAEVPNKKISLLPFMVLILTVVLIFILPPKIRTNANTPNPNTLKLEDLKTTNGNYQYRDFEWNSTIDDVRQKIDLRISDEQAFKAKDEPVKEFDFKAVEQFALDGQSASATFRFKKNQLRQIMFEFDPGENYQSWCKKQAEQFVALHGEGNELYESIQLPDEMYSLEGYEWETDTTILQMYFKDPLLFGQSDKNDTEAAKRAFVVAVALKPEPLKDPLLDLSNFKKTDNNFQYKDIKLDMSFDDTIKTLDFEIKEDNSMYNGLFADTHDIYESVQQFELDGQYAVSTMAFLDNQTDNPLREFWFEFRDIEDENHKSWFEKQTSRFIELHGEPSEKSESSNEILTSTTYTWDADDTRLRFSSTERTNSKNNSPLITIGITKLPK